MFSAVVRDFDEILPKSDRLVLGCIDEFLNFLFDFVEIMLLFRSFSTKNIKIWGKKEREFFMEIMIFFYATSYCKSAQTRLDHNSAKLARIENSFGGSLGGVFLCYWSNFQLGRWSVGLSFFILHSSFLPVSGSKGKG
jgi:hypothetical protein